MVVNLVVYQFVLEFIASTHLIRLSSGVKSHVVKLMYVLLSTIDNLINFS